MLVIRFQRTGRRNVPTYRLVVTEKQAPIKGKVKEYLGYYLPARDPRVFEFKEERIKHWVSNGAQPSDTVARLLTHSGMSDLQKFIKSYTKKSKKKQKEEQPEKAQPAQQSDGSAPEEPAKAEKKEEKEKEDLPSEAPQSEGG